MGAAVRSTPSAAAAFLWPVGADANHAAVVIAVVQCGDGGAGFMPLHVDGGEPAAVTTENIARHGEGTDDAVLREERLKGLFRGRSWETTN
jgi:hypothetical protein